VARDTPTHTHTHTERGKEGERGREREGENRRHGEQCKLCPCSLHGAIILLNCVVLRSPVDFGLVCLTQPQTLSFIHSRNWQLNILMFGSREYNITGHHSVSDS